MAKMLLSIELDYDADLMHGSDPEAKKWFLNLIRWGKPNDLTLMSNEIGDTIGIVKVISFLVSK